jgi:carboxypeptidase Taq
MSDAYRKLIPRLQQLYRLGGAMSLLGWDQEVAMPPGGARTRAGHRGALAGIVHEKLVAPELGSLLDDLAPAMEELDQIARANVREVMRMRRRAVRLPADLVREQAEAAAMAHGEWVSARRDDDWNRFSPYLHRLVALKQQEASFLAIGDEPYDSLLDDYEPGARTATLLPVFAALRRALTDLLDRLGDRLAENGSILSGTFDISRQDDLNRRVLTAIGFDFDQGRLDSSAHPFTESMGCGDVRITTRYSTDSPLSGLFSSLHEGGHALYEQGLPSDHRDTPVCQPVSLGIHESQSRLWENFVGRSRAFCRWLAPMLREVFPTHLDELTVDDLYRAVNVIAPNPIRIEADEVSYNLHIILRLEIERAMISGELACDDVPALWRQKAREYLQLSITDDRTGALQDIHWCTGSFGYFPTYTLGNLYAAMFWQTVRRDLPDIDLDLAAGRFGDLLGWLRRVIHSRGSMLTAGDLCREVTGEDLDAAPFIAYLEGKYEELCGT